MITKEDYLIAALVGFLVGVFAIPTLINLGLREQWVLIMLPLAVPLILVFCVWFGKFLSRWLSIMAQFSKFAAVGFLNTAIDFGVLNLLSLATGITSGYVLGGVNIPGFILAVTNGYFWNKFWVFSARGGSAYGGKDGGDSIFHDFPKFVAVSIVGLALNSVIVVLVTTSSFSFANLSEQTILNLGKMVASALALGWNFAGYKFIVFARRKTMTVI